MAKKKRKVPGLNASSTADISFILLIFFLVTTSMDTDMGLVRRLPPPPEEEQNEAEIDVKDRNALRIKVNAAGNLMVNDDFIALDQLCDRAKEFIQNPNNLFSFRHSRNFVFCNRPSKQNHYCVNNNGKKDRENRRHSAAV